MKNFEFVAKSFEAGKFSHAYLFSGNDAKEKKETLEKLIASFGCKGSMEQHADVVIVKPVQEEGELAKEITIKQIRDLAARVSLGAWELPFTVVCVEDAHRINQEAQSALLKILEEPRGNTVFFFLTEYSFLLLATLRSRMQEVRFWKFEENILKPRDNDIINLKQKTLHERFVLAKELAETPGEMHNTLEYWIRSVRQDMLGELKKSPEVSWHTRVLHRLSDTQTLLERTSVSPRLLLESLMLEL